ncbi:MAG: hypothetical protein AAGF23_11850, partial [Acidobacteriota bacterium]
MSLVSSFERRRAAAAFLAVALALGPGLASGVRAQAAAAENTAAATNLAAGESRRDVLATGEVLALELGAPTTPGPARLRVDQRSSDVTLRLLGVDGTLRLADQPLGTHQPEIMIVPAGEYRLEVRARSPGAAVPARPGRRRFARGSTRGRGARYRGHQRTPGPRSCAGPPS